MDISNRLQVANESYKCISSKASNSLSKHANFDRNRKFQFSTLELNCCLRYMCDSHPDAELTRQAGTTAFFMNIKQNPMFGTAQ